MTKQNMRSNNKIEEMISKSYNSGRVQVQFNWVDTI